MKSNLIPKVLWCLIVLYGVIHMLELGALVAIIAYLAGAN